MTRLAYSAALFTLWTVAAPVPGLAQAPSPAAQRFPIGGPRVPVLTPPASNKPVRKPVIGEPDPAAKPVPAEIVSVEKIWDQAPYNSFTDLIRFRGRWYCTFREGSAHVSPDGAIRVISSSDGVHWDSAFHVASEYADIRDPKFSITADGRLMLSAAAAYNPPTEIGHQTLAWYSLDGRDWSVPFKIGDPEFWLWRIAWHQENAYSMAYHTLKEHDIRMYVGPGGLRFRVVADKVLTENFPNEATLLFNNDDSALCLLRRDGGSKTALLGTSRPPYRGWKWRDLGERIGGPNMIRLPDDRIVVAGRFYIEGKPRTALYWLDEEAPKLRRILTLPSGGDTSYPGLFFHEGLLWVSYYSSHDGKACIYLAKVKLPEMEKKVNAKPKIAF